MITSDDVGFLLQRVFVVANGLETVEESRARTRLLLEQIIARELESVHESFYYIGSIAEEQIRESNSLNSKPFDVLQRAKHIHRRCLDELSGRS